MENLQRTKVLSTVCAEYVLYPNHTLFLQLGHHSVQHMQGDSFDLPPPPPQGPQMGMREEEEEKGRLPNPNPNPPWYGIRKPIRFSPWRTNRRIQISRSKSATGDRVLLVVGSLSLFPASLRPRANSPGSGVGE